MDHLHPADWQPDPADLQPGDPDRSLPTSASDLHSKLTMLSPAKATLSEADVRAALRDCYDPEIPCNIVDLGQIDEILVDPDPYAPGAAIPGVPARHRVIVSVSPTNRSELAEAQLSAQIQNRLAGVEAISRTQVLLRYDPPWTPLRITPLGRRTLGLDGNPSLVQIR